MPDEKETAPAFPPKTARGISFFRRRRVDKCAENKPKESESGDEAVTMPEQLEQTKPVSFIGLFRFATKPELLMNFVGLVAAVAAGAAQPLSSFVFGNLINDFVDFGKAVQDSHHNKTDPRFILAADRFRRAAAVDAAGLTYLGLGIFLATYIYMYTWVSTGEAMAKRIRESYLRAVLRQDIAFFDHVGAGEVATRIQTDTYLIQQGTSEKVALSISYLSAFFCGYILAFIRSWRLALACSAILPCVAITGSILNVFMSKYMELSRTAVANGGTIAEEVFSTIRTAQAFGSQKKLSSLYDVQIYKALMADIKMAIWTGCGIGVFFFAIYAAYGLIFSFGTTLILHGHADAGIVVNVYFAILIGSSSIALLAPELQAVSKAQGAAAKLFATIDRVPQIDSASLEGLRPETVKGVIDFEKVKFNYPSRPNVPVFKELSITFEAGKTAALVGASGSGKSTIVSLVERFYDPLEGSVKLDGHDLRTLNVKWLRSQIGLVSQEPTLFATTIAGNVAHGLIGTPWENAPEEEKFRLIKDACVKANADGFVSKLPNGYETMVGERGFLLSGGQKQRVAIARAIVSDPRVLLLDEATSALDTQSEGVVQNALDKASAGRTTITIAHRLSTIKNVDSIYVMGDGVVMEKGTHADLLARENGAYARLVQVQKLREVGEREPIGDDARDEMAGGIDTNAQAEIPLGRFDSFEHRSVASEISEKHRVEPVKDSTQYHSLSSVIVRIGKINKEEWWMYLVGAVFAGINGVSYPVLGIVFAGALQGFQLTDRHSMRKEGDRLALWAFIIAIVATIAITAQNYLFTNAASRLSFKLRSMSFRAILRQDIEFFDNGQNSTGSLTSNLSENSQKVNGVAGVTFGVIVQCMICFVGSIVIGLAVGWKLTMVEVACLPFVMFAAYTRFRMVVLKDRVNKASYESSAQLACEAAAAVRTVASLTREEECCHLYSQSLLGPLRQSNRSAIFSNFLFSFTQGTVYFLFSLVFWYGSRLVASTEYNTRQFFICLMSTMLGITQSGSVLQFVPDVSYAHSAASDIINLLNSTPYIDAESSEGKTPMDVRGHIRFEYVHFRYPTRPDVRVLRSLSFEVKPGTCVALVGASGSGKSTAIQLIERFYDPSAGKIYLDEQEISDFNVTKYRQNIALVSQEPTLYAGTIRFNVLLGAIKPAEEVTQEEIEAVCRDANILSFIQSLPDGFDTEVGGKGSQLSGGQKQRIAIARALLRNPKVLLLDEATSALDSSSERVVQEALDRAARGRTTIAIAHRLSTIQNADCIYFIRDGAISEAGTHDQLLARRGGYYEYVQLQALNKK